MQTCLKVHHIAAVILGFLLIFLMPKAYSEKASTNYQNPAVAFFNMACDLRADGHVLYLGHQDTPPSHCNFLGNGESRPYRKSAPQCTPIALEYMCAIADPFARKHTCAHDSYSSEPFHAAATALAFRPTSPNKDSAFNELCALRNSRLQVFVEFAGNIWSLPSHFVGEKESRLLVDNAFLPREVYSALNLLLANNIAALKAVVNGGYHFVSSLLPRPWTGMQFVLNQLSAEPPQLAPVINVPVPLIAPEKELKGASLVQALRRGGHNLYMRHAQATVGQDGNLLQTPNWWENCAAQRNLSEMGREQAQRVGAALRALEISITTVVTAQFCRARETGHLLGFGAVEVTEDLNHQIGQRAGFDVNISRFKRLAEMPPKGTNNLLVSHTHASTRAEERIMAGIQEAEIVVYKPDGKGGAEPVARIPPSEWILLSRPTPDQRASAIEILPCQGLGDGGTMRTALTIVSCT